MQGKNWHRTNEQSAKKRQMSVAVRKELLSLRHRFGERTSCEGHLKASFLLVNSGKILSKGERQMSTPYIIGRGLLFFVFRYGLPEPTSGMRKVGTRSFFMPCLLRRFASLRGTKQSREKTERQMNITKKKYRQTEH